MAGFLAAVGRDFRRATAPSGLRAPRCEAAQRSAELGLAWGAQHDPHEAIMAIFDLWGSAGGVPVPMAAPGAEIRMPIVSPEHVFIGIADMRRRGCRACRRVSRSVEQFLCAPVGKESPSVAAYFEQYDATEELDGNCPLCGAPGPTYCSRVLMRTGRVLLAQLCVYDMLAEGFPKIVNARIEASLVIVVHGRNFRLIAATEHIGAGLRSGHYITHRRLLTGGWQVLNDSGLTGAGPRHGSRMSDMQFARRQMYLCLYAQDDDAVVPQR